MVYCKYYENGKCKAIGKKIIIDCRTVKKTMPSLCKGTLSYNIALLNNDKRNGFSGTSGKINKKN